MIDIVIGTLRAIILILSLSVIFGGVKILATFMNHDKINNAIHLYRMQCLYKTKEPLVSYEDLESYESTLFRLWDWGYKRILPPEKFEIIKPFIDILKNKKEK